MGSSICAYHIHGHDQTQCIEALGIIKSPHAFVSRRAENWVTIVDQDADKFRLQALEPRVSAISKTLGADVLIIGDYDNDVCFYVAFQAGIEIDRYGSQSNTFPWLSRQNFPGDPARLAQAFQWWHEQDALSSCLRNEYKMEFERLRNIMGVFGIPDYRASTKFKDLVDLKPWPRLESMPTDHPFVSKIRDRNAYVRFTPREP